MLLYPAQSTLLESPNRQEIQKREAHRKRQIREQVAQRMLQRNPVATGTRNLQDSIIKQALEKLVQSFTKSKEKSEESGARNRMIGRKEYPTLVELRVAGRSAEEIARIMKAPESSVRKHLTTAMAEYRSGELEIQADKAQSEAAQIGGEKSVEFHQDAGLKFSKDALETLSVGVSTGSVGGTPSVPGSTSASLSVTV